MLIRKGIKLREVDVNSIEKINYSEDNYFIFIKKGEYEWNYVLDKDGNKIPKLRHDIIIKEGIGNEDVIEFLLSQIKKND